MSHAVTFDTLAFVNKIKASGIEQQQSEAIAEAVADAIENRLNSMPSNVDVNQLDSKIDKLDAKIDKVSFEFDAKLSKTKSDIIMWVVGIVFAQTAFLTAIKFLH